MTPQLQAVAMALVANGKGILAADETVATLTRRFEALAIQSAEQSRRAYREMLFTFPEAATFFSGVILQDETIRQQNAAGIPLVRTARRRPVTAGQAQRRPRRHPLHPGESSRRRHGVAWRAGVKQWAVDRRMPSLSEPSGR